MSKEITKSIRTYKDLKAAKQRLNAEVAEIENSLTDNPLTRIASSLFGKDTHDSPFQRPLSFLIPPNASSHSSNKLIGTAENLLGTFLVSNKFTRKYFIGFTIAKEIVPYAIHKFNDIFRKK